MANMLPYFSDARKFSGNFYKNIIFWKIYINT